VGSECFFRRGLRIAVLKASGKTPSVILRLIRVVTGRSRGSMQVLRSLVGRRSRGHVEFDEERIAMRTSSGVASAKFDSMGGTVAGWRLGEQ
jgi:hypothetical protein